jgi:membrane protein YdbS with pleckstrin-like domain
MTNSPEATPDAVSPADTGAPTHATPQQTPLQVEGETFTRLAEPRSENRLVLESGVWHQISPKYVRVQFIANGSFLLLVVAATLVLTLLMHQWWAWIPGGLLTVILVWTLAILPRQARSIGYQLRQDDLVFRRGILWQRFVAVPYGRMQLIDITHGPLDRGFRIAQLKFVTAAAATGVVIPGLEQTTADTLRDHLVGVAESRRTGL